MNAYVRAVLGAAIGCSVFLVVLALSLPVASQPQSPVTQHHLAQITALLSQNGISGAIVTLDARGRVELQGTYQDETEVDRGFSLAQVVVGARWVSPITPQNVKVKAWEECLSRILSGEKCPRGARRAPPADAASAGTAAPTPAVPETAPGDIAHKYALVVGVGQFKERHSGPAVCEQGRLRLL